MINQSQSQVSTKSTINSTNNSTELTIKINELDTLSHSNDEDSVESRRLYNEVLIKLIDHILNK